MKIAHFSDMPKPCSFQGQFVVHMLGLAMTELCTEFEISTLMHYKDMKGDEKCINLGDLGSYGSPNVISNIAIQL